MPQPRNKSPISDTHRDERLILLRGGSQGPDRPGFTFWVSQPQYVPGVTSLPSLCLHCLTCQMGLNVFCLNSHKDSRHKSPKGIFTEGQRKPLGKGRHGAAQLITLTSFPCRQDRARPGHKVSSFSKFKRTKIRVHSLIKT